jgi:hypothetical protein
MVVTEPITSVAGRNGTAAPLNNTSNTIARANTLTNASARAFAQPFTFCSNSIKWISYITNTAYTVGKLFRVYGISLIIL